ncbi:hypothetical protein LVD15_12330 [Fulvivirga maritima]|uniref:hypothetical protein n=1 Tax=Fulvivirga maritima TaxID=2904247 RepID=UPI001F4919A0|nr:hypothetical protein [Fulvivirga maritima]UII29177.1 hypothetical protein LVD15_12330 [Fulvivirga maritima]
MMKVRSVREVFIRAKEPFVHEWNKKGILYAKQELQVVKEVKGGAIQGNNTWYEDKNGDYYWSGGFQKMRRTRADIL